MESYTNTAETTLNTQKEKLPKGIIIILTLICLSLTLELLWLLKFFGLLISSGAAILQDSIGVVVALLSQFLLISFLGASFYGILKRKIWARKLIIWWFIASGIMVTFSFFSGGAFVLLLMMRSPAVVVKVALYVIVTIYVYRKRSFFKN